MPEISIHQRRTSNAGFTLLEILVTVAIFSFASGVYISGSLQLTNHIKKTTLQSKALLAAQKVLDNYRTKLPSQLPSSLTVDPTINVIIDDQVFAVIITHCQNSTYCPPTSSGQTRHLTAEIYHNSDFLYEVETVFTEFL